MDPESAAIKSYVLVSLNFPPGSRRRARRFRRGRELGGVKSKQMEFDIRVVNAELNRIKRRRKMGGSLVVAFIVALVPLFYLVECYTIRR